MANENVLFYGNEIVTFDFECHRVIFVEFQSYLYFHIYRLYLGRRRQSFLFLFIFFEIEIFFLGLTNTATSDSFSLLEIRTTYMRFG